MQRVFLILFLATQSIALGQKAESPYLKIVNSKADVPLLSSKANVHIAGTIAHIQLTQVYQNLGTSPIEAQYIFPMSTQAAVHDMRMTIGTRSIRAKIFEKQKAEKVYKKAIQQGKRAAKLDQKRPNVFQMKVGNLQPNEQITITIFYTEIVTANQGVYQFVLPGVVGPRYTTAKQSPFHIPYTPKGNAATFKHDINVTINAGVFLQTVYSNTHQIHVHYADKNTAEISLNATETNAANRDFILKYSLRGHNVQTGLLLYEGKDENFFALTIQPPKAIQNTAIPPREYLFIVDVSGSMSGYPLDIAKGLMRNLLGDLKETDTFNVQLFASTSTAFQSRAVPATSNNIEAAIQFLAGNHHYNGGGTRLIDALQKAYSIPRINPNAARTMVVLTDGYIDVEKDAFHLIENNLHKANVFTFGIGSSVNRYLIEGMARVGKSSSFIATSKKDALLKAAAFKKLIASPLFTQIQLKTEGFDIYDVSPKSIPDVFADRPILIYGKYKGKAKGKLTVSGWLGNKRVTQDLAISKGRLSKSNVALRYLWARKRIEQLDDYRKNFRDNVKKEVVQLSLTYNLASQYTSFVAIDEQVVSTKKQLKTVQQPLSLPLHVNHTAVGAAAKITGSSLYKKSFKIQGLTHISNTKKRAIQMWLKGKHSELIKKYLQQYKQLKIHFNSHGKIIKIEVFVNKHWMTHAALLQSLSALSIPKNYTPKQNLVITLKQ